MASKWTSFAATPAGLRNPTAIIAACRAGGVGVINAELGTTAQIRAEIAEVCALTKSPFGVKIATADEPLAECLCEFASKGLGWLIVAPELCARSSALLAELRQLGVRVLVEVTTADWPPGASESTVDGLVIKGHEAGGFVGEDSSFVLVQHWLGKTGVPLYVHGGLTPQAAAACYAVGVAGGVFDSQLLLLDDLQLPREYEQLLAKLVGNETVAVGDAERGEYFRLLVAPSHEMAKAFALEAEGKGFEALRTLLARANGTGYRVDWGTPRKGLLPLGQDVCFAAGWRQRYGSIARLFAAVEATLEDSLRTAVESRVAAEGAPLAQALGTTLPLVQGPMTRVSDCPQFAAAVAHAGALPMLAAALLKGEPLEQLLTDTAKLVGDRPWGIGLLGFAPHALLQEQIDIARRFSPDYAIIAGGRPDQALALEKAGIPSFLHVPVASLLPLFLREGARRFIFEGRECGGHIGPLSSFVLWSTATDQLLAELARGPDAVPPGDIQVLFAGGIHDARSSAMLQVLVAPLLAQGVKVGILMGSAYLFIREIVETGAVVPRFQQEAIACERTVSLASGAGHASRCAYTPFAAEFFRAQQRMQQEGMPADERRKVLDDLILGRLRIASKGTQRSPVGGALEDLDEQRQYAEGMYMLGQVATLRSEVTDLETLHQDVCQASLALLAERLEENRGEQDSAPAKPADVAVIGIATVLPGAAGTLEYWDNLLDRISAVREIPTERWDYRLYFAEDRHQRDKIYSKWGGFLDDLVFDPTRYGMPPRSVQSVDPMQLIALEVAARALQDAGYGERPFDRSHASIIVGASGGTGDVGTQYALRSELPRFAGELPDTVAKRLPEWTEDTFAGILQNVVAGRIANRLNLGGVNYTTDAACASSLASVYQGIAELESGRSDLVIAGGVDTVQGPFGYLCFSKTQALSPTGRSSALDASADGIVISEGVAMVVLKRLADAERDGDHIYAVIKGAGGGSDGKALGITAPLPAGQLRAMRRAYAQAGFGPETVGLFEAHGTGTVVGDTAELESTTTLVRQSGGRPHQAAIGSVKALIGHTKAAAGIAGLVKAALALHHRVVPPHPVQHPNAVLQRPDCPLYVAQEPLPWIRRAEVPRRAAVSAFGFGGTNFHVVMEEYTGEYRSWLHRPSLRRWPAELLVWSGPNAEVLAADLRRLDEQLQQDREVVLRDIAAGLAARRRPGAVTVAIVARDRADLRGKLGVLLGRLQGGTDPLPPGVYHGSRSADVPPGKLAVLFPGQGSQYPGMLRELALAFDLCADTLAVADRTLQQDLGARLGGGTLSELVFPRACYTDEAQEAAAAALTATDIAQPALAAVEAALFRLLQALGLSPDLFAGHSFGEFVALYAGGALDLESLLRLSAARGRCIVEAVQGAGTELGTMASVQAPREEVQAAIASIPGVIVANHNAPQQTILSGSRAAVKAATVKLSQGGVTVTELPVAAAFHSPLMAPAHQALAAHIHDIPWRAPSVPVYSNTTARPHSADVETIRQLLTDHLLRPVEFVTEIEHMYADGARIFVELGPKSVLTRLTARILQGRPHLAVACDEQRGLEGLLRLLGQLLCAGVELELGRLFENRAEPLADPYELRAPAELPRHAWLLNGSGARRAEDPVRQIGVTLDEARVAPQLPPSQPSSPTAQLVAPAPTSLVSVQPVHSIQHSIQPITPTVQNRWPKDHLMVENDERPARTGRGDSVAITEYFHTMRQFLESQERVMALLVPPPGGQLALQPPRRVVPLSRPALVSSHPRSALPESPTAMAEPIRVPRELPLGRPAAGGPEEARAASSPARASAPQTPPPAPQSSASQAPQTLAPAKTNGSAGATNGPDTIITDREKLAELLLGVVAENTGYPRDMIGLTQNLEADLGIDSIKRIQLVGAMLDLLPTQHRERLVDSRGKLNTQPTLKGMLDILSAVNGTGGAGLPFDGAEAGAAAEDGHLPRYLMVAREEPAGADAVRQLRVGHFVITEDTLGVAAALSQRLVAQGCQVSRVDRETLSDEALLLGWLRERRPQLGTLSGVVHLAPLGRSELDWTAAPPAWRLDLQRHEKSLFLLLHELHEHLADDGHVLAASALGGRFGREGSAPRGPALQGGAVGLLKSYFEERPTLRVKAVDVDPSEPVDTLLENLLDELSLVGGRQEIGYPGGRRTAFHTVPMPAPSTPSAQLRPGLVVLATGGARGVTAELLRELAVPGNTLVLTGRSPLPDADPEELAALTSEEALRRYFIAQVRASSASLTPAQIGRKVQGILAAREMRQNLADFSRRGARVEYHAVDVTDEPALVRLLGEVQSRLGGIKGVVHGAGIIEDKRVADKTGDSWSRVVETKVMGLLLLQKHLDAAHLEFFVVLSSVAGRYGNSGQADYATANELMNRLSCQLWGRWEGRVNVIATCWGPWGPTTFGSGMVTAESEAKFAEKGVALVSPAVGRRLFLAELQRDDFGSVEVVCGEGPWEQREAALGEITRHAAPAGVVGRGPLLGAAEVLAQPRGDQLVTFTLDAGHAYLDSHRIDGVPVLPAAAAVEVFAEAAALLWPDWRVVELRNCRLLKGVEVKGAQRRLQIAVSPAPYGSSEGFEAELTLQSPADEGRLALPHYRSIVRLAQQWPEQFEVGPEQHAARALTVSQAYGEWLFHGPCFQVIRGIDGLSPTGAGARVRRSSPSEWLRHLGRDASWLFDPAVLDAAPQMAILWTRAFRDETALPIRFGRVVRFRAGLPDELQMAFECLPTTDPSQLRANVYYLDEYGRVVLWIESLECVSSAALNRLPQRRLQHASPHPGALAQ